MAKVKVIFKGHNDVLLSDYNSRRYAFHKNVPQEVDEAVYKHMVQSGNVDAFDLQIYQEPEGVKGKGTQKAPEIPVKEPVKEVENKKKKGKHGSR